MSISFLRLPGLELNWKPAGVIRITSASNKGGGSVEFWISGEFLETCKDSLVNGCKINIEKCRVDSSK